MAAGKPLQPEDFGGECRVLASVGKAKPRPLDGVMQAIEGMRLVETFSRMRTFMSAALASRGKTKGQ